MKTIVLTILLLFVSATDATPKLDMEPGKWQHSFTMQSASGELEQLQLALNAGNADHWQPSP